MSSFETEPMIPSQRNEEEAGPRADFDLLNPRVRRMVGYYTALANAAPAGLHDGGAVLGLMSEMRDLAPYVAREAVEPPSPLED